MIRSFRHKGLHELYRTGKSGKVRSDLHSRCIRRLDAMAAATAPEQLALPGFDFHRLNTKPLRYSVHVNGPWCIAFGWDGEYAIDVVLEQYH